MRRRALPTVVPKPGSKGRNSNFPFLASFSSITTLSGFWNANIAMKNRVMELVLRVELDNQLFLDVLRNVSTLGLVEELPDLVASSHSTQGYLE